MHKQNRNAGASTFYFFTLFTLIGGLIMYIFLKQKQTPKTKETVRKIDISRKTENVDKNTKVENSNLTERQKLVLGTITEKGTIYPSDLKQLLPQVSTRTIRRDMTKLVELGLIEQKGSTKSTYYKYIG